MHRLETNPFDADTALERVSENTFRASLRPRWWVERGPHGGYLAAFFMRAFNASVGDAERSPRTLAVHFLAPPAEGSVDLTTTRERVGRSRTSLSARLTQGGHTMAIALAAFSRSWDAIEYSEVMMPQVRPPEDIDPVPLDSPLTPAFFKNFTARWALGNLPFTSAPEGLSGGWIGLAVPRPLDTVAMTTIADAWIPSVFPRMSAPRPVPTVDLTVHFRSTLPHDDDPLCLAVFRSQVAAEGFFVEDGEMWSRDGRLLAQSRQLAVLMGGP